MKERITLRLYQNPRTRACCEGDEYCPDDRVVGWDYHKGQQIGLRERHGEGYLMGLIERVDDEILEDDTGRYRLAVAWTQD